MRRERVPVPGGHVEITIGGGDDSSVPGVCSAHPVDAFAEKTTALLADASGATVVCANPRGVGGSSTIDNDGSYGLDAMVDDLEAVRKYVGAKEWTFWGMSGGGWLGQLYARRYPKALRALILESVCPCLRQRVSDHRCLLSPFFPAWRTKLEAAGLLDETAHVVPLDDREALEWFPVPGVGTALRRRGGPALLISPTTPSAEMVRALPWLYALDARPWLKELEIPSLVICGTADPLLPIEYARALRDGIRGAEFLAIEKGGHVPVTECRPEVARAVQAFLAKASL